MSARPARAATAGSLALALALALPAAAFADEEERGRSEAGPSQSEQRSDERGRSESAPHGRTEGEAERAAQGEGRARSGRGNAGGGSADGSRPQGGSGAQDDGRAAGGDPRGNNGTIKIDGEAFDDGRGNEPHVGCVFEVDFYGFDAGDTASITLTGHAPTGGGLLHSETATPISNDAAGGGQDRDATLTYSVSDQLSELTAVPPHPQQGWHVKVAVDVDSAPGGAKQKVFWINCPQSGTAGTSTSPSTGEGDGATGTSVEGVGGGTTTTAASAGAPTGVALPATVVSGTTVAAAERREALSLGSGTVTLAAGEAAAGMAGAGAARGEAAGDGEVSAQGAVAPSVLPFTGSAALLYLLGLGSSAVGVGAIAHRMGRQQADLL